MKATLLIICFYLLHITTVVQSYVFPPRLINYRQQTDKNFTETLLLLSVDIIQDTTRRISILQNMQHENVCAAFEIGYLIYIIQDKYRRMVDLYNTSVFMGKRLYLLEHVLYLEDIEHIYWEINHLTGMLHEIERKYAKETRLEVAYDDVITTTTTPIWFFKSTPKKLPIRTTRFKFTKYLMQGNWPKKRKPKPKWWPLEYDANYSLQTLRPQDKIINDLSWGTKLKILKDLQEKPLRRVGLSFLRMPEATTIESKSTKSLSTTMKSEDSSMKMKLFRLMYETVRDSDLKAKRAELIKTHYSNYSSFEIGFIMGDITDKFNIMTDIGLTLKRLYEEWKPMEHINAYEQIANKVLSPTLCQYTYRYLVEDASEADKDKVKLLAQELVVESKYKIKQTDPIRDLYASQIEFQVGTIFGYIREKYKTMLEIYRQQSNKYNEKAKIVLTRVDLIRPIHYLLRMEVVSSLEVEIDRLVHILETIPNASLGIINPQNRRRSGSYDWDSSDIFNFKTELFKKLQLNP